MKVLKLTSNGGPPLTIRLVVLVDSMLEYLKTNLIITHKRI